MLTNAKCKNIQRRFRLYHVGRRVYSKATVASMLLHLMECVSCREASDQVVEILARHKQGERREDLR